MIQNFNIAWLSLTYNCNNRCVWCYAASNCHKNRNKQFNVGMLEKTAHLLSQLQVKRIILIGGEPTIYPEITRVIGVLNSKDIQTGIVSNGRRLIQKRFLENLKRAGLGSISIGIEGSTAELHDETTQIKGSYKETLSGLENCISLGMNVSTNTVISEKNSNDLENIIHLLKNYPLNTITFNICGVCVSQEGNNRYLINPRLAVKSFERAYEVSRVLGRKVRLVTPMPLCFFSDSNREDLKKESIAKGGPCQLVHGKNFVIDYNGDILPCTHLTGFSYFNLYQKGRIISKEEFIKYYNDPDRQASKFRKRLNKFPSKKCERSRCSENCTGGCPLYWLKYNPDKEIHGI
ncbi:radical SAM protein [Candidatus Pacearchaeota archaeon]|nr:radical SAM protein [Candidatus Pacearchaeota archaeon]